MKRKPLASILSLVLVVAMLLSMTAFAANDRKTDRGNDYPIILVHGLFGWGGQEVLDLNYWGGTDSLRGLLNAAGYEVYTPSVSPIASNWDRACELYAYLVGGTVDYGQYHSSKNGHARYGRTFPGVLPELSDPDCTKKVHLVGHSMGGETIRMLAQLLENGDPDERRATTDGSISPLFAGESRHWIESVTTLCTPHDGSQYDTKVYRSGTDWINSAIGVLGAAFGANINEQNFGLDFKLEQWGLVRQPDEDYASYLQRVANSSIWDSSVTDTAVYDLDVDGAAVLNGYAKAQDDIYYFSVACSDTYRVPNYPNNYLPYHDINPAMLKSATYMGAHVNYAAGHVQVTPEWWENDGIVSVRSAIAPHENSTDRINENYGTAADGTMVFKPGTEKGVWNYIEKIERTDHINMVGQTKNKSTLQPKFYELAAMLASIPADTKAPAEHVCPGAGFTDMPAYGNWAHTGLDYCIEHGLIKGTSATTVSPNTALSRAQLVTILWRQAGSPGAKHAAPFTDLTQEWYRQAVAWAAEHQIVKGVSATRFDPDSAVTRQDMTVILYRYADSELHADASGTADLSGFPDADRVSAYAEQAMRWAVSEALIQGTLVNGTVYLDPKGTTTRAQAAKILMTFCKTVAG